MRRLIVRGWLWTAVGAAVAGTLLGARVSGQSGTQASADEFAQSVLPIVSRTCMGCHNDRLHTGNLSFEQFRSDPTSATQKAEIWQKVLEKLEAGQMPPRPAAPLSAADLAAVTGWIHKLPGITASMPANDPSTADPGRVT